MRSRTDTWKALAATGEFSVESVAIINGVEYDAITAPVIKRGLFSGSSLSVGNCISATLTFTLKTTDEIARSAEVYIKYRLFDSSRTSEWATIGPFYVNKRTVNDDLISFECYDSMLKGNQPYVDDSETLNWPKPMADVVNRCAELMGVQLDSRNVIKTGDSYMVTMPDATTTLLMILGNIAAVHGGNWTITDDGKLRLVPIVTSPVLPQEWWDEQKDNVIDEIEDKFVFSQTNTSGVTDDNTVTIPVVIDELLTGHTIYVTRVTMEMSSDVGFTAGNSEGYEILITNNPYVSQQACDDLLNDLYGIVYEPYSIKGAVYDPAAELGDYMVIGESSDDVRLASVLYNETRAFDVAFRADADAPAEEEEDNEYSFYGQLDKLRDDNERLYKYAENLGKTFDSKIEQTRTSIELSVASTYTPKADAVASEVLWYYQSNSPTVLDGGEWSRIAPQWSENYYIWTKIQYIMGDGTSTYSDPVCTMGHAGVKGDSVYFHIKYSENPDGVPMTETPSTYIGTYVDGNPGDSDNPNSYTWSRFQGLDGAAGEDGEDGQTYRLFVRYSNDGGTTFTDNGGTVVGIWIGVLVTTNETASATPADYSWSKFQGQDGTSVNILGSYDTIADLEAEHPTGSPGDGYIVGGDLYVWSANTLAWTNVGQIQGPNGKDAIYVYITSDASTMVSREETALVTFTACVSTGAVGDIDPDGLNYTYAWLLSPDSEGEYFIGRGKHLSLNIDETLCDERASLRVALVNAEYFYFADENGDVLTTDESEPLEVA